MSPAAPLGIGRASIPASRSEEVRNGEGREGGVGTIPGVATHPRDEALRVPARAVGRQTGRGDSAVGGRRSNLSLALRSRRGDRYVGQADIYTRVSTLPRPLGPEKRGDAADAYALAGLWLDLDLADEERPRGFPDLAAAVEFAHIFAPPTLVVSSGHGAHAWHLFEEPWL